MMIPNAAIAARSSPLLQTRKNREAPVCATSKSTMTLRGVSNMATASASNPMPASKLVAFFAQRPLAWYSAKRANPYEINAAMTTKFEIIAIHSLKSMILVGRASGRSRLDKQASQELLLSAAVKEWS